MNELIKGFKKSKIKQIECKELYAKYVGICEKHKENPISIFYFGREVKKELNRIRVRDNKKLKWVYVPIVPNKLSPVSNQHILETSPVRIDMDSFCEVAKELFYYGNEDFDDFVDWYRGWVRTEGKWGNNTKS